MSGPQIWLCLFTFRPIVSKKLNGLSTIDALSWLDGAVVTHLLWVQELRQGFLCLIFCLVVVVFLLFFQNTHYLSQKFAIPFTILIIIPPPQNVCVGGLYWIRFVASVGPLYNSFTNGRISFKLEWHIQLN